MIKTGKKEDCRNYCIFEKKVCKYADKRGCSFRCKAPSDEAMLCRK